MIKITSAGLGTLRHLRCLASALMGVGHLIGVYPTSLSLLPNSPLRSELWICPRRLATFRLAAGGGEYE